MCVYIFTVQLCLAKQLEGVAGGDGLVKIEKSGEAHGLPYCGMGEL